MPAAAIFGCQGLALTQNEKSFFRDVDPLGFIVFARNIDTPSQLKSLCQSLRDTVGRNAPILVDQEGGRVERLSAPHWSSWLPALEQVKVVGPETAERATYLRYRIIASELYDVGLDVNCAPVADIATGDTHPILRNRCFGMDVNSVALHGRACARALLDGGVLPVLKHIPGHGRPQSDSHIELPRTSAALDVLMQTDFEAFRQLNDVPFGMTGHVLYDAIDPQSPATQSNNVIDIIRKDIGFSGALMTDDLSMQALQGSFQQRATASLSAGCDLLLHCNGDMNEMREIAKVTPKLSGLSQRRVSLALSLRKDPQPIDIDDAITEYSGLVSGG